MSPDLPARMRAAVVDGPGRLSVRELPVPHPGEGEVLVRVEYCGICGTDVHGVLDGWTAPGTIGGHEWSGRIVACGAGASALETGDLVVGGPAWCGRCEWCRSGRPALCIADPLRSGRTGHGGAFAEYHLAAATSVAPVPPALPPRVAALAEPLAVALHGLTNGGVGQDSTGLRVLVSGAGPLGLLVIAALADRGATELVVAEPSGPRREQARRAGAREVVAPDGLPAVPVSPTDCRDDGYDVIFETSGRAAAIGTALGLLRPAGRLVLLGTGSMSVRVDPVRILLNELVVTGAYCYDATGIDDALQLLASGRLPLDALLAADDVGLDDLLETIRRLGAGELPTKVLVRP